MTMMSMLRPAEQRGKADFGWLDSRHSFSFGHYFDPQFMGYGPLRVINEDKVKPGKGFDPHPHQSMEIISYVLDGALEHKDSIGNGSVIRPGDVQRMSAGTGIVHSEYNASKTDPVHFLQIWVLPEKEGGAPGYEQKHFDRAEKLNRLRLVASHDGREGSVTIQQDADLYAAVLEKGARISHSADPARLLWLQVVRGEVQVGEAALRAGDGLALAEASAVEVDHLGDEDAEILLFDMVR